MATVGNVSVARVGMLLCFGTALLSLAIHWRISDSMTYPANSVETQDSSVARAAETTNQPRHFLESNAKNANASNPAQMLLAQITGQEKSSNTLASTNKTKVVVDLSDRRVYVYRLGRVIASYPTGIGKAGWETPTGTFQVINKQLHPVWRHPITGKVFEAGADSPLGDRWIGFWTDGRNHIGFHGTPDDSLVGSAVSHGCLRMRNPDVRLLYKQAGMGTAVEVRD